MPPSDAQTSMFDSSEIQKSSQARNALSSASVTMKGTRSIARLRDRVNLAVKELSRLRTENKKLKKELERVGSQSRTQTEGASIVFPETAGELRERIESCIRAVDEHMQSHEEGASKKSADFWNENRHDSLSKNEIQGIIEC